MSFKNLQKGISTFQVALMGGGAFLAITGFLMFAGVIPSPWGAAKGEIDYGAVSVWGIIPEKVFSDATSLAFKESGHVRILYTAKDPATFDSDLTEALASGRAPDAIILTQENIVRQKDRIVALAYPARDLKNNFIQEGELFSIPEGVLGLPIVVDPMVMYWNRDMFGAAGIPTPPTSWTDLYAKEILGITKRGGDKTSLVQSAFALGEFDNVTHAKDILATLFLEAGNTITEYRNVEGNTSIRSTIEDGATASSALRPSVAALQFYTRFADPTRVEYSWNRALPPSIDLFSQGALGMYFGYASERGSIAEKNPHLNFDVAIMPQAKNASGIAQRSATFGRMYAIATLKGAKNQAGAFYAMGLLSDKVFSNSLATTMGVASARRDILSARSADPYQDIYNRSALISAGWLDPDPLKTEQAFRAAVADVISGRRSPEDSINVLGGRVSSLLQKGK